MQIFRQARSLRRNWIRTHSRNTLQVYPSRSRRAPRAVRDMATVPRRLYSRLNKKMSPRYKRVAHYSDKNMMLGYFQANPSSVSAFYLCLGIIESRGGARASPTTGRETRERKGNSREEGQEKEAVLKTAAFQKLKKLDCFYGTIVVVLVIPLVLLVSSVA